MSNLTCLNCGGDIQDDFQIVDLFDEIAYACSECRERRDSEAKQ